MELKDSNGKAALTFTPNAVASTPLGSSFAGMLPLTKDLEQGLEQHPEGKGSTHLRDKEAMDFVWSQDHGQPREPLSHFFLPAFHPETAVSISFMGVDLQKAHGVQYSKVQYCCTVLHCTVLVYLYCTVLYCTGLFCSVLYLLHGIWRYWTHSMEPHSPVLERCAGYRVCISSSPSFDVAGPVGWPSAATLVVLPSLLLPRELLESTPGLNEQLTVTFSLSANISIRSSQGAARMWRLRRGRCLRWRCERPSTPCSRT